MDSRDYDIVGVRLPNGKVKVLKSKFGSVNEEFADEKALYSHFQTINEGAGASIQIMEMINE
jgi:hypothetical protein